MSCSTPATPETLRGWAIPAATDIAFAMGVVSLLGNRVPESLKIFLLALAIIDDLGAIVIIAIFYTADLSLLALGLASVGIAILVAMNRLGVQRLAAYVLVGIYVWACVLESGVHATLAGTIVGAVRPAALAERRRTIRSLQALHPRSAPLGRLRDHAGLRLRQCRRVADGLSWETIAAPVTLGIGAGPVHRQAGRRDGSRGIGACRRHGPACPRAPVGPRPMASRS